jgi:hypothetical protein
MGAKAYIPTIIMLANKISMAIPSKMERVSYFGVL